MDKNSVIQKLKEARPLLQSCGVSEIGFFGSVLRNENRAESDIDLLIDFEEGKENFDNFFNACEILDEMFKGFRVDVLTRNGLSPFIGPHILKEVEYVFA